jgi:hypothetical protein
MRDSLQRSGMSFTLISQWSRALRRWAPRREPTEHIAGAGDAVIRYASDPPSYCETSESSQECEDSHL